MCLFLQKNKGRKIYTATKKLGCQARVVLEERVFFDEMESKVLKAKLETDKGAVEGHRRIVVTFRNTHNHSTNKTVCQRVTLNDDGKVSSKESILNSNCTSDNVLVDKIHSLVWQGMDKTTIRDELIRWLWKRNQIQNMPNNKDLSNHFSLAKNNIKFFREEVEKLQEFVEDLKVKNPQDKVDFESVFPANKCLKPPDFNPQNPVILVSEDNAVLALAKPKTESTFQVLKVLDSSSKLADKSLTSWPKNLTVELRPDRRICRSKDRFFKFQYRSKHQQKLLEKHGQFCVVFKRICHALRTRLVFYTQHCLVSGNNEFVGLLVIQSPDLDDDKDAYIWQQKRLQLDQGFAKILTDSVAGLPTKFVVCDFPEFLVLNGQESVQKSVVVCDESRIETWNRWFADFASLTTQDLGLNLDTSNLRNQLNLLALTTNPKDVQLIRLKVKSELEKLRMKGTESALDYWQQVWLDSASNWSQINGKIKSICCQNPHQYLHPESVMSNAKTYLETRRLLSFNLIIRAFVNDYFPMALKKANLQSFDNIMTNLKTLKQKVEFMHESGQNLEDVDQSLQKIVSVISKR